MSEPAQPTDVPRTDGSPAEDRSHASRRPIVTFLVAAAAVVVFVGHMLEPDPWNWEALARWGVRNGWSIYDGATYPLLTSVFVHIGLIHIAFNLYVLWILGRVLEERIGALRYLAFLVAAAWVSSAAELALAGETGVGLSGVVYAMFGFMWMARPVVPAFRRVVNLNVVMLFLIWLVFCIVATRLEVMNIANGAHFGGLIFGAPLGAALVPRWRRLGLALAGLLLAGATVSVYWAPWAASWQGVQAWRAQDTGDWDAVAAHATRAIEIDPTLAYGYHLRGFARSRLGHEVGALADYTHAAALDPEDDAALNGAAWLFATASDEKLHDRSRAIELARRALDVRPDEPSYLNTLGVALYRAGRWQDARDALDRSMAAGDGGNACDWLFAAMADFRLGRKAEAKKWRDRAVAWLNDNPEDPIGEFARFRAEAETLLASD